MVTRKPVGLEGVQNGGCCRLHHLIKITNKIRPWLRIIFVKVCNYASSTYCQERQWFKTFSKVCTTPSDAWWSVEVTWDDCSRLLLGYQILNYGSFSHHWSLKDHHCCACNKKGLSENSGREIRLTLFTPWRSWPSLSQVLCCIGWLVLGNPEWHIWWWYCSGAFWTLAKILHQLADEMVNLFVKSGQKPLILHIWHLKDSCVERKPNLQIFQVNHT